MRFTKKKEKQPTVDAPAELEVTSEEPDDAAEVPDPVKAGWPSSDPIVVGEPTATFEPNAVGEEYRRTPYRPDTLIDGWSRGPFAIRAASVRGHLHRYNGAPRQDDFAVALPMDHDRLIVSVADGVSAAAQSHIGATTAVRYSAQWLEETSPSDIAGVDWHSLFQNTAWKLTELAASVLSLPEASAEQAEQALATTLTCVVCEPHPEGGLSAYVAGVGDSGAWILSDGHFTQVLGGKQPAESGLSSSAVSGLPRVPPEIEVVNVLIQPDQVLLVGTDGFGDPLGGGDGDVGSLFRSLLHGRVPALIEFAHTLDFSRETFDDDRTLVAVWPTKHGGLQ
ncbi:protein phosphatase 2C domain-containing protein [Nocardia sp. NPDC051321]|uniref:protein phosphatase 2C domain-containing protein n=1 Tax=Nocardia sp. NPDC051321 TaxID=3364323 RepID=UPI0037A59FF3